MQCRGITRTELEAELVARMVEAHLPTSGSGQFLNALLRAGYLRECQTHPGHLLPTKKSATALAAGLDLEQD